MTKGIIRQNNILFDKTSQYCPFFGLITVLENEVSTWNDYITGENYSYDLVNEKTGEVVDGGFWTGDIESLKAFVFKSAPMLDKQTPVKDGDTR